MKSKSDSIDKLLEDLFIDLEYITGNRQTHRQLIQLEDIYKNRFKQLKEEANGESETDS